MNIDSLVKKIDSISDQLGKFYDDNKRSIHTALGVGGSLLALIFIRKVLIPPRIPEDALVEILRDLHKNLFPAYEQAAQTVNWLERTVKIHLKKSLTIDQIPKTEIQEISKKYNL